MAKKQKSTTAPANNGLKNVSDYRFPEATRKNNPPAKIAAEGFVPLIPKAEYFYNPRRPPELRFDPTGRADELPELLATAMRRKLTEPEAWVLAEALRVHEPWLEWAGKRETKSFAVDPVALHIHERVSTQAILKAAAREDVNRSLFADPEQEYNEAVQFYRHDVDWSNRLILGDSLQVMSSLGRREDLAGKVQMIYMDPPYGIKFKSNFQPEVGNRDPRDRDSDLTREPETVKAYRDTWHLGVHSYLAYLRDRLVAARELLSDSGSIFVQISDENLHSVRSILDEVFGRENFIALIVFAKTTGFSGNTLASIADYILWYAKQPDRLKFRSLYRRKEPGDEGAARYRPAKGYSAIPDGSMPDDEMVTVDQLTSQGASATAQEFEFQGRTWMPASGLHWKTTVDGLSRLAQAGRVVVEGASVRFVRCMSDFPVFPINNIWNDIGGIQNRSEGKIYVVQTAPSAIERCMLMTTDPGDLVFDPTCGSGTTASVAEQWGRRWITADTSRVAIAIARQRLLTSRFDYFKLRDEGTGIAAGFRYRRVPHVSLKKIAQNLNLDSIFAKYDPTLETKLRSANVALNGVSDQLRNKLRSKLALKLTREGKKAVTDRDHRRWELPRQWQHWKVPFDTDPDYPADLKMAVEEYRATWRAKMDEVNACIAANADQEELVDQPEIDRKITRVSGPFTVEAVQPPEMSLGDATIVETGFAGEPDELPGTFVIREVQLGESAQNLEAYLSKMVELLRMDGVRFPNNKEKNSRASTRSMPPAVPLASMLKAGGGTSGKLMPTPKARPQSASCSVHSTAPLRPK